MNEKRKFRVNPKDTVATSRPPPTTPTEGKPDLIIYIPQLPAFQHTLKRISPILKKSAVIENSYPALKTLSASHSPHNQEFFSTLGLTYICVAASC